MSKHTPRPWVTYEWRDQIGVTSPEFNDIADCKGATFSLNSSRSREEILANACLIAAAPDLLAALKALLFNATYGNGLEADYRAQDEARAAIAKAEGKS
jgi:hypothetical protein